VTTFSQVIMHLITSCLFLNVLSVSTDVIAASANKTMNVDIGLLNIL